ncbi:SsrA-binding protein SmpB [Fulvivirga sp. M361]|uniref:SsrA-binding protein SmpB n=1 Tax=Fulvivirga sp. M361 TaxID=2594266 RepID=UPI00117B67DD|nr:SsrA-binding protein SmpB [Fulvivirga sp. M361]TRX62115.1 SsrA-binding protein SmpB [Fulvivirga sp. M361]
MAKEKTRFSNNINIRNRKASFEYEFIDTYETGIVLKGTEIKSIREAKVSLQEGYCYFRKSELFVKGINIAPYEQGSFYNHEPTRERKLLLHRQELSKLETKSQEKGLTIIPIRLFINSKGFAKVVIALAKGKKLHDKRDSLREKDQKREIERHRF